MATPKVTLKLLINKMERKVVFAEANKDFVDFLFCILSLPVGSIVKLLENKTTTTGCLGDLYQSIEALSETYMQPNQDKNSVLNPKFPKSLTEIPLLLPDNNSYKSKPLKFYTCSRIETTFNGYSRHLFLADNPFSSCPICRQTMRSEMAFVSQEASTSTTAAVATKRGFVKDMVTYMVMDNLEVMPMSTISCITWLNKFNVGDLGSLEEKVVNFGPDEALKLLKASMECKNVFTSVFLGNKGA
ncbi:hypothetical protein AB3S75_034296 [Citrus x aurantiifolia]